MLAFCRCTSLEDVDLDPIGLTTIGEYAFYFCKALKKFDIPITVLSLQKDAFFDCTDLKEVKIDKKLHASIESSVFDNCPVTFTYYSYPSYGNEYTIDGVDYRISYAAYDGTGTVTVFGTADKTNQKLVIPAVVNLDGCNYKVTRIGPNAFAFDQNIIEVVLGSNVLYIDDLAFFGCSELRKVSGGINLRSIGVESFGRCSVLSSFNISSSRLSKIAGYAFSNDYSLKTLYLKKTTKLTKSGVKNSLKYSRVKTVKVKKSKVKKYKKIFKKSNSGRKVTVKK